MISPSDVKQCVRKWQKRFGLSGWRIHVGYYTEEQDSIADCRALSQYHVAYLNFNLDRIRTEKLLEHTVIHELLHVVLDPLTSNAKEFAGDAGQVMVYLEEAVVTQMEKWPVWRELE